MAVPFEGPTVVVHVNAPSRVVLQRRAADGTEWVDACDSPCDQSMPLNDVFRVTGGGIITIGAGVATVLGGALLVGMSAKTSISVRPATDVYRPDPVWRTDTERAALPKAQFAPIFSRSF